VRKKQVKREVGGVKLECTAEREDKRLVVQTSMDLGSGKKKLVNLISNNITEMQDQALLSSLDDQELQMFLCKIKIELEVRGYKV